MTLPYDCARCKPLYPDDKCKTCERWAELPGQTFGERTALIAVVNSQSPECIHVDKEQA